MLAKRLYPIAFFYNMKCCLNITGYQKHAAVYKIIEPFLIKSIQFHACPNDCIVFRGKYADLLHCPSCNASRYVTPDVPAKRFHYLSIGPRLERLFATASMAKIIQSHSDVAREREDGMHDVHDSPAWRNAYSSSVFFGGDPRGISLALCTDGLNPYRVSYSMWPIVLTILNLPPKIRYSFSNLLLVGIVPGNNQKEPSSLDPYLEILVDELLGLSNKTMFDAYRNAPFQLKVQLFMFILDYPGIGRVMGSGAYQGCAWCEISVKLIK